MKWDYFDYRDWHLQKMREDAETLDVGFIDYYHPDIEGYCFGLRKRAQDEAVRFGLDPGSKLLPNSD